MLEEVGLETFLTEEVGINGAGYAHEHTDDIRATPEQALALIGSPAVATTAESVNEEQKDCASFV